MAERKIVSDRIEYLRTQILQISQSEFAERLHLQSSNPRSTVNNWESGDVQIKSDTLTLIAKTFKVSTDWLLGLRPLSNPSMNEDTAAAAIYTGLSDKAVESLHNYITQPPAIVNQKYIPATINRIIESGANGLFLLGNLAEYLEVAPPTKYDLIQHCGGMAVTITDFDMDAYTMVEIQNLLHNIKMNNHIVYTAKLDDDNNVVEEEIKDCERG